LAPFSIDNLPILQPVPLVHDPLHFLFRGHAVPVASHVLAPEPAEQTDGLVDPDDLGDVAAFHRLDVLVVLAQHGHHVVEGGGVPLDAALEGLALLGIDQVRGRVARDVESLEGPPHRHLPFPGLHHHPGDHGPGPVAGHMARGAGGEKLHQGGAVIGDGLLEDLDGVERVVDGELGGVNVGDGHGLTDNPAVQGRLAGQLPADGGGGAVGPEAGGPGLLHAGVHVAFVIENDPGDVEILAQGVVEGAVADIVDGPVPGKDDNLGEDAVVAVLIGLV